MGLTAECGNTYGETMWFPTKENKGASLDTFKFEFENYIFWRRTIWDFCGCCENSARKDVVKSVLLTNHRHGK